MAAKSPQGPAVSYTTDSTRALLRVVILCFVAAAAISSRLFSVIRKLVAPSQLPCCFGDAMLPYSPIALPNGSGHRLQSLEKLANCLSTRIRKHHSRMLVTYTYHTMAGLGDFRLTKQPPSSRSLVQLPRNKVPRCKWLPQVLGLVRRPDMASPRPSHRRHPVSRPHGHQRRHLPRPEDAYDPR